MALSKVDAAAVGAPFLAFTALDLGQVARLKANMRFTFQAMVTKFHSPWTLSMPRSPNWRNPITDLIMPKTGSGVCLRKAQSLFAFGRAQAMGHGLDRGGSTGAGGAAAKRSSSDG